MTYEELKAEAKKQGHNISKVEPYVRLLPCTCGSNYRRRYRGTYDGTYVLVCIKCGKEARGKSERDVRVNWNKMMEGE